MRFKTLEIQTQFNLLTQNNPKLKNVLNLLDQYTTHEFGKDICLTCIFRTMEEQEALYAPNPAPPSVHTQWEGADVRSWDFDDDQIHKMLTFLNAFAFRNGKPSALYHTIPGNAPHFHIQIAK